MLAALLAFLPVLGAPLVHAPVLRWDLLPWLKRPLDGGATLGGRRLLGDNKTWRGAIVMVGGVALATAGLAQWEAWWTALPAELRDAGPAPYGLLLGLGIVVGELPNSFLKRRLDIEPGSQRGGPAGAALTILDQGDLVLGAWVCLAPIWLMSVAQGAFVFVAVSAIHLAINVVGYAIGARTAPI